MSKLNRKSRKHLEEILVNYILDETIHDDFGYMYRSVGSPQLISQLIQAREKPVKRTVAKLSDKSLLKKLDQIQALAVSADSMR
ncbi:hypothetical protein ACFQ22_11810 [Lentilactobacillus raoultii]|uniref:Uncharacterized protein n=1 Tax=Lentilactobacillus raoultii TaxID=1987503 RepID=A0ABW3PL18_9LACO|nr:hypothetical protein [Lentilactobacillus raoultii]